jgi:hypothetical protein
MLCMRNGHIERYVSHWTLYSTTLAQIIAQEYLFSFFISGTVCKLHFVVETIDKCRHYIYLSGPQQQRVQDAIRLVVVDMLSSMSGATCCVLCAPSMAEVCCVFCYNYNRSRSVASSGIPSEGIWTGV